MKHHLIPAAVVLISVAISLVACRMNNRGEQAYRGHIVNVIEGTIFDGVITVRNGIIASIQPCEVAPDAPYYMPGWVDSHVHIESSMMLPTEFARIAKRHGTIAAIADPHEIGNVLGIPGIELMLDNAKLTDFYFGFGVPSCVPAVGGDVETSGAVLDSHIVDSLLGRNDIYALSEMMNYPGVLNGDAEVMAKIAAAKRHGKPVDGHAPGVVGEQRMQYAAAGISTDHECSTMTEARDALKAGMYVQIREGSAAKNYDSLHYVLGIAPEQTMFATDDSHPTDLLNHHIDQHVRRSLALGYPLLDILKAASLNPIRHYKLPCGLLQVGDPADFIVLSDTTPQFRVLATYIRGVRHEDIASPAFEVLPEHRVCHALPITVADIQRTVSGDVPQIVARDCSLLTEDYVGPLDEESQKIVTYNRYVKGAKPAVGYIRGFKMTKGAFAQTIAHDCHNIIAVGADDESLVRVINHLIELGGGIVATDGEEMLELPLPIAGLISTQPAETLAEQNLALERMVQSCGCTMDSPFITLGFMALPVIPVLKLTDRGLFDAATWKMIE